MNTSFRKSSHQDLLKSLVGIPGIPKFKRNTVGDTTGLTTDLDSMGPTLEELLNWNKGDGKVSRFIPQFSLKTTLMIVDQLLYTLEQIHSRNVVVGALDLDSIHIGKGEYTNMLYITNLYNLTPVGECYNQNYMDADVQTDMFLERNSRWNTSMAYFTSVNYDMNGVASPKDDLESLCYIIVYMLSGTLPWVNQKIPSFLASKSKIIETKRAWCDNDVWYRLPIEILKFKKYIQSLDNHETPDYKKCRKLFKNKFRSWGYESDEIYDWTNQENLQFLAADTLQSKASLSIENSFKGMTAKGFISINKSKVGTFQNLYIQFLKQCILF